MLSAHNRGGFRSVLRVILPVAAGIAALTAGLVPAGQADAAPRRNVVVFGDSFTANHNDDIGPACGRSPTSWPSQLQRITGKNIINEGCSGSTLNGRYNIYDQAKKARQRGGLNAQTQAVLVQLGFNDFGGGTDLYTRCFTVGCPGSAASFPRMTTGNYASRLRPLVDYVRYYAPNAKIAIVGYPDVFGNRREVCTRVAGSGPVVIPNSTAAPAFMNKLQKVQQDAAKRLGAGFVNLQAATRGHDLCSTQPWVNGIFYPNPGIGDTLRVGHPTPVGDRVAAGTVKRTVGL